MRQLPLIEDVVSESLMSNLNLIPRQYLGNAVLWRLAVADGLVSPGQAEINVDIEGLVQRAEASLQRLQELYAAWDGIMER